jgi:N-acetylneuraminic acid mutarotase
MKNKNFLLTEMAILRIALTTNRNVRFYFLISIFILFSFSASAQWYHVTNFPASGRFLPFCFTINGKAYLGCGYDASPTSTVDNYEYNPISNSWSIKSIPPFIARMGTFSFTIDNYGYVGSGSTNGGANVLTDFWRYDPITDTWLQMADFPGVGRIEAATFVINGKAYIVSGVRSAGYPSDCWEYNPVTDTWNVKANPPSGFTPGYVIGFSFSNYGYCGIGGWNSYSNNDFWRYDPVTDSWIQLATLPLSPQTRTWTVGGVDLIGGKGFVGLGGYNSASNIDFWIYDFSTDTWQGTTSLYDFPYGLANGRTFNLGGETYVGTGQKIGGMENYIYKFDSTTSLPPSNNVNTLQVFPNPANANITINLGNFASWNGYTLEITNSLGQIVFTTPIIKQSSYVDLSTRSGNGLYFVKIISAQGVTIDTKKIILQ